MLYNLHSKLTQSQTMQYSGKLKKTPEELHLKLYRSLDLKC